MTAADTAAVKRTTANRVPYGMCAEPWIVKACYDCRRNRANMPAGTWSGTPDIQPSPRNGGCNYWLGGVTR